MKKPIICIDRDGTLINDTREHLFLGRDKDWQENVHILPTAVEGLKVLNTIPEAGIYMITNQAGVAISDYPELTEEKAHEVCRYVVEKLQSKGGLLHGYFLCPYATFEYVSSKPDVNFHPDLVHDSQCLKPALDMVLKALAEEDVAQNNADIFVVGDRASDVQTALNADGTGILIPFVNEPGEEDKVRRLEKQNQIYVAENMLATAEFILKRVQQ